MTEGPVEPDKSKMSRWQIGNGSLSVLEQVYTLDPFPGLDARRELAKQLNVSPRQVQVWFQNKRQRTKKGSKPTVADAIAHATCRKCTLPRVTCFPPRVTDTTCSMRGVSNSLYGAVSAVSSLLLSAASTTAQVVLITLDGSRLYLIALDYT